MIVSYRCPRVSAALLGLVCLTIPARSQDPEIAVLRGEIRGEPQLLLRGYQVALFDPLHHHDALRTGVHSDGSFEFRQVPPGEYMAKILTLQGDLVHQEMVTVRSPAGPLFLPLPPSKKSRTGPATVSLRQLQNPPAAKAIQAFASARKFSNAGNFDRAAGELEKAIQISPEYADAYIKLAALHLRTGRYEQAIGELQQAIQIGGPHAAALCNLSYAQAKLKRGSEAIESARQALKLDAGYAPAHLMLGSVLAADPRTLPEAIPHLERAAESMPSASALQSRDR